MSNTQAFTNSQSNEHTSVNEYQNNLNYSDSGFESQKVVPVEGTPFFIMGNSNTGYFGVMAKYRVTELMHTYEDVLEYINSKPWDLIITLIGIITEYHQILTTEQQQ